MAAAPTAPAAAPTVALREETVKTAIPKTLSDAGVLIGLARGYFQEQAIVLDDIFIPTGGEMVSSLATGQIEAALGAPSAGLFNAIGRGALIKLVGDKGAHHRALVTRRSWCARTSGTAGSCAPPRTSAAGRRVCPAPGSRPRSTWGSSWSGAD